MPASASRSAPAVLPAARVLTPAAERLAAQYLKRILRIVFSNALEVDLWRSGGGLRCLDWRA
jgi:hypothetical protein